MKIKKKFGQSHLITRMNDWFDNINYAHDDNDIPRLMEYRNKADNFSGNEGSTTPCQLSAAIWDAISLYAQVAINELYVKVDIDGNLVSDSFTVDRPASTPSYPAEFVTKLAFELRKKSGGKRRYVFDAAYFCLDDGTPIYLNATTGRPSLGPSLHNTCIQILHAGRFYRITVFITHKGMNESGIRFSAFFPGIEYCSQSDWRNIAEHIVAYVIENYNSGWPNSPSG